MPIGRRSGGFPRRSSAIRPGRLPRRRPGTAAWNRNGATLWGGFCPAIRPAPPCSRPRPGAPDDPGHSSIFPVPGYFRTRCASSGSLVVGHDRAVSEPRSIGRYAVRGLLGTGGVATVWLAYDDRLEDHVAIKVLAENWSERLDIRERFEREA